MVSGLRFVIHEITLCVETIAFTTSDPGQGRATPSWKMKRRAFNPTSSPAQTQSGYGNVSSV